MAGPTDNGRQGAVPLSDLIWQLKLQAERQLGAKDSLRDLIAHPARLEELLKDAEARGDEPLRKLAADIRAQQQAPQLVSQPAKRPPVVLYSLAVLVALLAGWILLGGRQHGAQPAPAAPAAAPAAKEDPVTLLFRMHGSNTIGEKLAPALAEAYLKLKGAMATQTIDTAPDERRVSANDKVGPVRPGIEIFAHGSATAFKDLQAGTTNIGMASRRIKPEERDLLMPLDGDLTLPSAENVLGLDGVAVIVNAGNPVQSLTIEQVGKIFAGAITNWSEVGGTAGPIQIYARDDKSGTFDTFKSLALDPLALKLLPAARRFESSSELSDAVSADTGGVGFIGLPYVRRAKTIGIAASAGNPAVVPTQFTVGTEDYPLSRRLYLYLPATAPRDAADFVEFALSEAGQDVVRQIGFVPQSLYTQPIPEDPSWPAEYKALVAGAERLSVNFRFESGGEAMDTKALRDMQRLLAYLSRNQGRSIELIGFSDSIGSAAANLALSRQRAEGIAAALKVRGIDVRDVRGFGSAIPVASNDTDAGRLRNRRVEVWVK